MLNQGRVFYIVPLPCQPFIFRCFRLRKSPKNLPAYYLFRGAHSTANRFPVNRFLKNFFNSISSALSSSYSLKKPLCQWLVPRKRGAFYRPAQRCQRFVITFSVNRQCTVKTRFLPRPPPGSLFPSLRQLNHRSQEPHPYAGALSVQVYQTA